MATALPTDGSTIATSGKSEKLELLAAGANHFGIFHKCRVKIIAAQGLEHVGLYETKLYWWFIRKHPPEPYNPEY